MDQSTLPPTETPTETPTPTPTEPPKVEPKPEVPEAYTPFKVPEGLKLEGEVLTKATELFKSAGLSQEAAQSFVDFHAAQLAAAAKAPIEAYNSLRAEWKTAHEADPEIGPKAAQIKETLGKALDTIGNPKLVADFKHAMNLTGVGDHPAFIKVLNTWAKQVVEGRPTIAGGPVPVAGPDSKPKSAASALYPNLP